MSDRGEIKYTVENEMATANTQIVPAQQHGGLINAMAAKYGLEPTKFMATIQKTVMPTNQNVSMEQLAAFLMVANRYQLDPFTKEIYAFPSRGGIQPIVSVDGWATIINRQPNFDGMEFQDHFDANNSLTAITCKIYRKDRKQPIEVTEYMNECKRNTDTWRQYPARMLRHKAMIQCARYAFALTGIVDPDEAERIAEATDKSTLAGNATAGKLEQLKSKYLPKPEEQQQSYEMPAEEQQSVAQFDPSGE